LPSECFFNQPVSDLLQHIAVFFEIAAIYLVWIDHRNREDDLTKKGKASIITRFPLQHKKRTKELIIGLVVGFIAVLMELYQLASQYLQC
jgi:hypothetical protein